MTDFALDPALADSYVHGSAGAADALRVEQAMDQSPQWRALVGSAMDGHRLERNFAAITAELEAPKRGLMERFMVRVGLHEHVARLMAATPILRRSWYLSTFLVLLFAQAASTSPGGESSISVFLALAPLVPVLGVALAYGPGVDPAHDMTVATPLSGFRLVLLRSVAVLATSVLFGGVASTLLPAAHGLAVVGWMLPALALTLGTLAVSTALPTRLAAGVVGGGWLLVVSLVANSSSDGAMFGAPAQFLYVVAAVVAAAAVAARRDAFEVAEVRP